MAIKKQQYLRMKKVIYVISLFSVLFLSACKNSEANEPKPLSEREKALLDSLSKVQQRTKVDSMKRKNPLLILPPDSTYTGEYTDKYDNGIVKFKGFFRFGKRHGMWMSFYPNGLKWSELHFDKGLREGPNMTFDEIGKPVYEGFYKNDLQDSIWKYYDSTGSLAKKFVYKEDKIVHQLPLK